MNMLAKEYIEKYVHPEVQAYAEVVVSYALKGIHVPLKPDQTIPDDTDWTVTVFIRMDTEALPAVLISDHSCKDTGLICQDHPDQPYGHNGCYGLARLCPYPTCPTHVEPGAEPVEVLGAGS